MKKILISLIFLFIFFFNKSTFAQESSIVNIEAEQRYQAVVVRVMEEGEIEVAMGVNQPYQKVEVEILDGGLKSRKVEAQLGGMIVSNDIQKLKPGDKIFVSHLKNLDGTDQFIVADFVRTGSLYVLGAIFVLAILIIGGFRGLSSLFGLAISFVILLKYILPQIAAGNNPLFVTISGAVVILTVTLYLAHGLSRKTTAAVLGTFVSLIITGALAYFFVNLSRLSGLGSEEAGFLSMFPGMQINLQGILLSGIIIGALGVLDDVSIGQSAAVFELKEANPKLSWKQLYVRGLRIGRHHIASMVNTLVLAYAGASLPLLLLFTLSGGEPLGVLINREMIANEVVRTLVGSLGLISAVPITTALAAIFSGSINQQNIREEVVKNG